MRRTKKSEYIVWFDKEQGEDVAVGELIRCKDCKHYSYLEATNAKWHLCNLTQCYRMLDDYCSRAERKEDADK